MLGFFLPPLRHLCPECNLLLLAALPSQTYSVAAASLAGLRESSGTGLCRCSPGAFILRKKNVFPTHSYNPRNWGFRTPNIPR